MPVYLTVCVVPKLMRLPRRDKDGKPILEDGKPVFVWARVMHKKLLARTVGASIADERVRQAHYVGLAEAMRPRTKAGLCLFRGCDVLTYQEATTYAKSGWVASGAIRTTVPDK